MKIYVIHGPNLNMLGKREPATYGSFTLPQLDSFIIQKAQHLGAEIDTFQSNFEGEIVSKIQQLPDNQIDGLVINAAAYTHTSISIRDALLSVNIPFVEVHLSNIYKRDEFRHVSYLSDIALGVIAGFGIKSYELGIEALVNHLRAQEQA